MATEEEQLEAARAVKEKAAKLMERFGQVCGVGITRREGVYAVKVNLEVEPSSSDKLPEEIDGVPIVVRVIGSIRKQTPGPSKERD